MKRSTRRIRRVRKDRPILKKILTTSLAIVMAGGAVAGITAAAYYPIPFSPMNSQMETVDLGDKRGPVAYKKSQLDTHSIAIGTRENCSLEIWILPIEYKTVAEALEDHKNAKPMNYYENRSNDWNCDRNADKQDPYNKKLAYYGFGSGVTGLLNKDLANNRKA